jgi:NADPH:quinone reductase-like Zn-dependent oxidoreductase
MDLENKQRLITELLERASNGDLKLPIEAVYSLDDIATAVSGKVQSGKKGKVLLKP